MTGVMTRTVLLGVLSFAIAWLATQTHLYATAAVLAGIGAVLCFDLWRRWPRESAIVEPRPDAAAAARARELDHAHALLDTVPAALIALDGERVVYMNRAARPLAARDVAVLTDIDALRDAASQVRALRPGARAVITLADGTRALVSVAGYAVPGATPRKLLAIQRLAGDLDAVEVHSWEEMARVLAHEMMNSLTPIASLSESLEQLVPRQAANEELSGALEVIRRRSHGLMNFVERYRSVTELPTATPRAVALESFLDGIDRLMSAGFRERGIAFARRLEGREASARIDPELVEQALINLLRNASDAVAGTNNPVVTLACRGVDDGLAFEVIDNGPGLPTDDPAKVLTPFYSTKPGGGGIGLSVARHVALAHGGQLRVRRREGGGAVFSLWLPS